MRTFATLLALFCCTVVSAAGNGIVGRPSPHSVQVTMDRLEAAVKAKGIHVFARIDHAGGAAKVGAALRPTQLLVFGHPKAGTPLMLGAQSAGLDLPLKALVWEDAQGRTWVSYNDPVWIVSRHAPDPALAKHLAAIEALVAEATRTP